MRIAPGYITASLHFTCLSGAFPFTRLSILLPPGLAVRLFLVKPLFRRRTPLYYHWT